MPKLLLLRQGRAGQREVGVESRAKQRADGLCCERGGATTTTRGGNATATNFKNAKIDGVDVADFNPIRWKSQYFDTESGFYYIGGRYYSPETKRYVDAGAPETALANATTIYGLNLQNSTLTNPVGRNIQ